MRRWALFLVVSRSTLIPPRGVFRLVSSLINAPTSPETRKQDVTMYCTIYIVYIVYIFIFFCLKIYCIYCIIYCIHAPVARPCSTSRNIFCCCWYFCLVLRQLHDRWGKMFETSFVWKNWYENLSNFCMIFWDLSFSFNEQCQCQRPDLSETFISDSSNKKKCFYMDFFSTGYLPRYRIFSLFKFLTVWTLFSSKIFWNFGKDRL